MKTLLLFLYPFLWALAAQAEPPDKPGDADEKRSPGTKLTLSAATRAAVANNRSIQEARAKWESMKAHIPQAAAWDDPRISTSIRLGRFVEVAPNSFTDQMVSIEQMIPLSGKNQSRARIAAAEALGALEELRRSELDVVMKVRSAFIQLTNTHAQLDLNRASAASLSQTLDISKAKFEVGTRMQADVLTAQSELIRIEEARHDFERALTEQETQLEVLMNRDAFSALGEPVGDLPTNSDFSVERLRSLILTNRPQLRMAIAKVTAAKARVELAKREWIPDPTLSVGAQRYNEASQAVSEVTAGVSFNVPWFNGRKYRAEEHEAETTADAAQRALEGARTEALGKLRDQLAKIETFHHHVTLFRDRLLPTVRQTVEANRAGYESDKTSFLDLVSAQRALLDTESMYQQHLSDFQMALAELEALVGADLQIFPADRLAAKPSKK